LHAISDFSYFFIIKSRNHIDLAYTCINHHLRTHGRSV